LPLPEAIVIRVASESDYPAIARLQQQCPDAAQWPLGDYSGCNTFLALLEKTPAGFCAWRQTAPDEAELLNLGVAPAFRRRGVARALLEALRNTASGALFLEVAENNHGAIALYTAAGWTPAGYRPGYYHHGTVNAVVMKKGS